MHLSAQVERGERARSPIRSSDGEWYDVRMVMQRRRRVWTIDEFRNREPKTGAEISRARSATDAFLATAAAVRESQPGAPLTGDEFQALLQYLDDED